MVYSFSYAWDDLRNVLYLHQILSLMKPLRKGCLLTEYYGNISTSGMQECAECWARRAQDRRGVHTALVMTLKTQTQNTGTRQPDTGHRDTAGSDDTMVTNYGGCVSSPWAVSDNIISDEGQYDVMIPISLCLFCTCVTVKLSTDRIMKPVTRAVTPIRHAHGLEFYTALYCWGRWDFRPFVLSLHHQHERGREQKLNIHADNNSRAVLCGPRAAAHIRLFSLLETLLLNSERRVRWEALVSSTGSTWLPDTTNTRHEVNTISYQEIFKRKIFKTH